MTDERPDSASVRTPGAPGVASGSLLANLTPEAVEAEEMPRVEVTRRRALAFGIFVASVVAFLYFVLPQLTGLRKTWDRADSGNSAWIAVALGFELLSFAGYVTLFRAVFVRGQSRVGWRESYEITMAGLAATRLFAAAGAGGVALTAWALRRSGMERRIVACRMVAFLFLLYIIYLGVLVIDGIALRTGLLPGGGPFALTVIPAIFAGAIAALALGVTLLPEDAERRLERWASHSRRGAHLVARAVAVPALIASGVRSALGLMRARDPGLLGAPAWWFCDIGVLWACFHAFGQGPPFPVIVMCYFLGMLGNALPLPGGIGGVDGGMIGAFAAFHVDLGLAAVSVLVYRGFSFWLPTIPGAVAYFQLRRRVRRWRGESLSRGRDISSAAGV